MYISVCLRHFFFCECSCQNIIPIVYFADKSRVFDWPTRFKIIKGVCEGLKFLHEGLEEPIYHMNLKPTNILLDHNMVPKLADFSLPRLIQEYLIERPGARYVECLL
ncbi:hypothetical protein PR202_gb23788 [Eleusine coracana subsp. coracana]|uniref:non-specific serine/threonine protein kinase n=1 Tax=Eleusine coracana subsp. coracana TaxID=191504 RepID=A0AAV5FJI0_ELECO|nr:hypothetical protein PR202_gb23788 [Eleusine coracana subsp. coracana]